MTITLNTLNSYNKAKMMRRGRGNASGKGTYSGRGVKGQKARSGSSGLREMSLRRMVQQIPKKRGFTPVGERYETVTLQTIERCFQNNAIITPKALQSLGLVKTRKVKIVNKGDIKIKVNIKECKITQGARVAIESKGGTVV